MLYNNFSFQLLLKHSVVGSRFQCKRTDTENLETFRLLPEPEKFTLGWDFPAMGRGVHTLPLEPEWF